VEGCLQIAYRGSGKLAEVGNITFWKGN